MKRSAILLKSLGLKPSMAVNQLSKSLRKSTSTKLVQLTCLARCWPPFPSYPCSNLRLLRCNKKRMTRRESLMRPCNVSIKVYHLQTPPRPSGIKYSVSKREKSQIATSVFNASYWKLNCQPLVSRLLPCLDLTLTCLPTFVRFIFLIFYRDPSSIW